MRRVTCYAITVALLCYSQVVDLCLTQSCGTRKAVNQLIVNGTETKDGHWPWHATIFHKEGLTSFYACGGTILDQNTVLTAAHCVETPHGTISRTRLVVQVGRHRISAASKRVQEHKAYKLIVHPKYNVNSIGHDIALVVLDADIAYTDYIQPVCLWNRGDDLNTIIGTRGTVIGFGIDESDYTSDALREASIPVVSHMTCIESNRKAFAYQLTSNMFCAGGRDGVGACNGDSGGGFFFNYSGTWFVRGVVSFTKLRENTLLCDTNEYTVFTDVAKYLKWIKQHMPGTGDQPIVAKTEYNRKTRLLPMSTCGLNPYASREELSESILLGYPWIGLVVCAYPDLHRMMCQATLISDFYLISSAECASRLKTCDQFVRLGKYHMSMTTDCVKVNETTEECSPPVQIIPIESIMTHPEYKNPSKVNDIALIRLQYRVNTTKANVKPICLPVANELRSQKSTNYIQTSWKYGLLEISSVLERPLRESLELTECQKLFRDKQHYNITTGHICTKFNKKACSVSMSSDPLQLVQQVQGTSCYVLYGILSHSFGCYSSLPTVYTNVATYVDWILENIQE